jgi:hypothetical protein
MPHDSICHAALHTQHLHRGVQLPRMPLCAGTNGCNVSPPMNAGGLQVMSTVPGIYMLTLKRELVLTLRRAYGPDTTSRLMPLTFIIPEELTAWQEHLQGPGGVAALHLHHACVLLRVLRCHSE